MRKTLGFVATAAVLALMVLTAPAQARTGSNTGGGAGLVIALDPNAPGTKWGGELTVSFVPQVDDSVTAEFFIRLRQGTRLEAFAGRISNSGYPQPELIQEAVTLFISETVIPDLYGCTAGSGGDCPPWALKAVDQYIEDMCEDPGCMLFMMMDVVIAVKE